MKKFISLFLLISIIVSCAEDDSSPGPITASIQGKAQKGPFVTNSIVTISELNSDLSPTGRTFNARTLSDEGDFELIDVELISDYVEVKVEGLYYNEITGSVSNRELTITSIARISENIISNVNLMTQLENSRIKELVNQGMSFNDAKYQAQKEFNAVFYYDGDNSLDANSIDISDESDGAAFLFAVSTLFLTTVNEFDTNSYAEWLEFLLEFELDLADNGLIDDIDLVSRLVLSAPQLISQAQTIRDRFEIGNEGNAPNFLPIIANFQEQAELLGNIRDPNNDLLPASTENGTNILALKTGTLISGDSEYVIAVNIPEADNFDINIGVNADFMQGGSFSATSSHWDAFHVSDLNVHYDMALNSSDSPGLLEIPIQMSGYGQLDVFVHYIHNGVDNGSEDFKLFWVESIDPIEDADTLTITSIENNTLYVDASSYSKPVYLIYPGLESIEDVSFHQSTNVIGVSFPDLLTVSGHVYFHENPRLQNISFSVLKSVNGYFYLNGNSSLLTMSAPEVNSIGQYLYIDKNFSIIDFNLAGRDLSEDFNDLVGEYQYICRMTDGKVLCVHN